MLMVIGGLRIDTIEFGVPRAVVAEPAQETVWRTADAPASFAAAVRENEEVVPVNDSTWVLSSGVTVGR
ncbi:hypothetical protein ABZ619_08350 [Streptomyces sp. NPDC007851]|uniref:hypothetical protein n=1 Tax=Streptomyces sp. NPDC007851 TaxID=3155008 RepID=UPI0033DE34C4